MRRLALAMVLVLVVGHGGGAQAPAPDEWQAFEGTFSATGRRDTVPVEQGGAAATIRLSGALTIRRGDGLRRGFRVEAIGYEEESGTGVGRAVWTDDRGDRIFSRMVGVPVQTGRRSAATITGGTGRYAGIEGTYTFTWQYVMPGEQGVIQARTLTLTGRVRRGAMP